MCSRVALCAINGRIKRNRRNRKCATVPEIRSIYRDGAAGATRRREGEFHRESRRSFMDDDCRGIRLKFRTIRRRDARRSYGNPDSPRDQRGATAKSHRGSSLYIRHSFFFIAPVRNEWTTVCIVVLVIFRKTALRYCARMHVHNVSKLCVPEY